MISDAIVILAVGGVALLLPLSGAYRSYLARGLARKAGAEVPAAQVAALEARVTRGALMMGGGIALAGLLSLLADRLWGGSGDGLGGFYTLSLMVVFGAAGVAIADIRWPGTTSEGPRTARASSPTVGDYLPPRLLTTGRVFIGLGLVALGATLLLSRSSSFDAATIWRSPVPLLAVAIPVLAGLSHLAIRRVLDAPQPARDEVELYWQDAVRAQTLSSLSVTTPIISLFALVVCGSTLDDAASAVANASGQVGPPWSLWVLVVGYLLPAALLFGTAIAAAVTHDGWSEMAHFRQRLWDGRPPQPRTEGAHA